MNNYGRLALLAWALAALTLGGCGDDGAAQPLDSGVNSGVDSALPLTNLPTSCVKDVTSNCKDGWCFIPAGTFTMGTTPGTKCVETDEDQHQVTLTRAFEISASEVTAGQFRSVMGYTPPCQCPGCKGDCCPLGYMTVYQATAYCNALSQKNGITPCYTCTGQQKETKCSIATAYAKTPADFYRCPGFRLPTEAEWEYAYRARTTTDFYNGLFTGSCLGTDPSADLIGYYKGNCKDKCYPAGQKLPNPWGLYDMAGNVMEMVQDLYQWHLGTAHVTDPLVTQANTVITVKGGDYTTPATHLRGAARFWSEQDAYYSNVGFRCARSR